MHLEFFPLLPINPDRKLEFPTFHCLMDRSCPEYDARELPLESNSTDNIGAVCPSRIRYLCEVRTS